MEQILIIDDDRDMCLLLEKLLKRNNYQVLTFYNGFDALKYLSANSPDLILCDLRLGDIDGISILEKVRGMNKSIPFIMISAYADIQMSLNAINKGAFEYITKPIVAEEILLNVENALAKNATTSFNFSGIASSLPASEQHFFGNTDYYKKINTQINLVAPTDYNIVLCGESGSGKKALAYEIHKRSQRKDMPFVTVTNEDLLFQYKENSHKRNGDQFEFFEAANGGTVLLHNISGLQVDIQEALLRIIKEKRIQKAGHPNDIFLNVRVLISSTEFLWHSMLTGSIKENLFYFLNDYSIELLPLRSRKDEIILFANYFLQQANEKIQKPVKSFTPEVEIVFKNYLWPGNLRELKNVVTKAMLLSEGDMVEISSLPAGLRQKYMVRNYITK